MAKGDPGYEGNIAAVQCGVGGLSVNLNPSKILLKNVITAEGAVFRYDHWRKEPGTKLFGTNTTVAADPADRVIVALNDWHPTEAVQRVVHLRGDGHTYYTDNGGSDPGAHQSTTTSGPGTRFGYFVTAGQETGGATRKLFLFRSNFLPTFVNGDVTNDTVITTPAADWNDSHPPIVGLVNGGRLWAAGNTNAPHFLYASEFQDPTDFMSVDPSLDTASQQIPIFPGVGERIYALRNYQGFIVIFKYPRGIFLLDARDTSPANWLAQQVTDVIGVAPTPNAALQLENDILFMGSDGQFYLFSAVLQAATGQQNMETANLAMDLEIYQFLLDAYDRSLLNQIQSVYQPFWQTATFSIPQPDASGQNTARFMFDFTAVGRKQGEPRFSYSYRDKPASLALWRDPADFIDKPMYGDYLSNIIQLEQESRTTWDGGPYPFRVQTPHTNLGEFESLNLGDKFVQFANRNKIFDNIEVEYVPFTNSTVTLSVLVDGILRQTIDLPLLEGGQPLGLTATTPGAFVIGFSALAGGGVRSIVRRLNAGSGRRISLFFENTNYGEDVALTHFFLGFRPGDTTQSPRK
jgi:hypothetical protein